MEKSLKEEILNKIKPSKIEHDLRKKFVDLFLEKLKKSALSLNFDCEFFIGGSFGKNTYLKGSSDVDIFVRFSLKYKNENISDFLKKILDLEKLNYKIQKGSRDYFKIEFFDKKTNLNYLFELVPSLFEKDFDNILNSTDVSAFHVDFLKKKCKGNKDLCDQIRLAKQFFKSKKLYGAESYINGFSGHTIDILIIYYKSLENLLNQAKFWEKEVFIDINSFYENLNQAKLKINSSKFSNLIVIDPIISTRNASKALSEENFYKFLLIAQNFKKLKQEDFVENKFDLFKILKSYKKMSKLNKMDCFCYIFNLEKDIESFDICGSKMLKLKLQIKKYFLNYDFRIFRDDFYIDFEQNICLFVFLFENSKLPKLKKVFGPKVFMKNNVSNFIKDKEFFFVEKDRIYSYQRREIYKISQIANLDIKKCKNLFNKNLNFIKNNKIIKY